MKRMKGVKSTSVRVVELAYELAYELAHELAHELA
jgi:hypothetical protein